MKLNLIALFSTFALILGAAPAFAGDAAAIGAMAGKKVFVDYKCNKCHTVTALKIDKLPKAAGKDKDDDAEGDDGKTEPPDLSGMGKAGKDAAWIKGFLKKEIKNGEKKHKKKFTGTDKELDDVTAFLLALDLGDAPPEKK